MSLTLATVEGLAPDQASLKAASKLTKGAKWPLRGRNAETGLIWGECQGSGANPYRVMADTTDHGYKCTCPSRKFPCKHSLALMWMFAEAEREFDEAGVPDWVNDWVGRRRKGGGGAAPKAATGGDKSIGLAVAEADAPEQALTPEEAAKREAQAAKRAEKTRETQAGGLDDLEQWVGDQLRLGLAGFLGEATERCRRIAARLVDAKAQALAGRLDEMPARLLDLPAEERPDAAIRELGKLVLLARAWRAAPDDPDLRRSVGASETREQVTGNPDAVRCSARWEVLAEWTEARRDGLISQSTWLLNLGAEGPRFALLLDFFPVQTGKRGAAFSPGERFDAHLVFYPSAQPLRAFIETREAGDGEGGWPEAPADPMAPFIDRVEALPWSLDAPVLLPEGRICEAGRSAWWRPSDGGAPLPIAGAVPRVAHGMTLQRTAALWDGLRLRLMAGQSGFGRIGFDG